MLKPYQTARLTGFTNPDSDPGGLTYNVTQSRTAVGAGGLSGRGVEGASQTRLDYLPEHATDFVFASFAEQRGFVGTSILLLLYLLVVWRGLRVVTVAGDLYGAVVAGGIVFAFLFQVFVNVGMTMGIAPVTGIPLPVRHRRRLVDGGEPDGDRRPAGDPRARSRRGRSADAARARDRPGRGARPRDPRVRGRRCPRSRCPARARPSSRWRSRPGRRRRASIVGSDPRECRRRDQVDRRRAVGRRVAILRQHRRASRDRADRRPPGRGAVPVRASPATSSTPAAEACRCAIS